MIKRIIKNITLKFGLMAMAAFFVPVIGALQSARTERSLPIISKLIPGMLFYFCFILIEAFN